jgi:urease accessory protein
MTSADINPGSAMSSMRLWQLISPALPIGAYAYSQGLEYAVDTGWVNNEEQASEWILGQLNHNLAQLDAPVFLRLYEAWQQNDIEQVNYWNRFILASREAAELYQEDCNLGRALNRVLQGLEIRMPELSGHENDIAFVTCLAFACHTWKIDRVEAVQGLLWSWCENQVAAAIKIIPLGQTSGQKIMSAAIDVIAVAVNKAMQCEDEEIGMLSPGVAMASALHETQYSRLFRS